MVYLTSCLYGDAEKFERILKSIQMREDDRLYVLGDVLDGNDEDPGACLKILDKIMEDPRITLVLGDHELFRAYAYACPEYKDDWLECAESRTVSGESLNRFLKEMTRAARERYARFLMGCEVSVLERISDTFFYMCHGRPSAYIKTPNGDDNLDAWQRRTTENVPEFSWCPSSLGSLGSLTYFRLIKTDPVCAGALGEMSEANTVAVTGQMSAAKAREQLGMEGEGGFVYAMGTLAFGRELPQDPLPVIQIDDGAAFSLQGVY